MRNALLLGAAFLAGSLAFAGAAKADPVNILITDGTHYVTNSGTGSATIATTNLDGYSVSGSATGTPPFTQPNLDSNTINVSGSTGSVTVWVWETGITQPTSAFNLSSAFSDSDVTNASIVETTYISAADNSVTGTTSPSFSGTKEATATLTTVTGVTDVTTTPALSGAFSEAEEYVITFTGSGAVDATISTANVPEPMTLALLGTGLAGLGVVRRRRRAG